MNDDLGDIEALCDLVVLMHDMANRIYTKNLLDKDQSDLLEVAIQAMIISKRIRKQQSDNVILNEKGQRA